MIKLKKSFNSIISIVKENHKFFANQSPTYNDLELQSLLLQPNSLRDLIKTQIKFNQGELKFSKYWETCLTHPEYGYYSKKTAFSKIGDFTTSPQISPIFGQIFGVWIIHFLEKLSKLDSSNKKPSNQQSIKKFRLIQLGPGRGYFIKDILRTIQSLKSLPYLHSINMIQKSMLNTQTQQQTVLQQLRNSNIHFKYSYQLKNKQIFKGQNNNIELRWFKSIEDMQSYQIQNQQKQQPITIILAHQFFDALPTTTLVYTQYGWRQKVVKISETGQFYLQASEKQLPQKMIPNISDPKIDQTLEVSYESLLLMQTLAQIISNNNGAIINVDYGNYHPHSNSIRAIKNHKYVPYPGWLQIPGDCDISAYVDFQTLQYYAEKVPGIKSLGIVEQGYFLQAMGINARLQMLMKYSNKQKIERLQSEYQRLTHRDQMGQIYKVQIITKEKNGEIFPFISEKSEYIF